jgi:hypothetical protein
MPAVVGYYQHVPRFDINLRLPRFRPAVKRKGYVPLGVRSGLSATWVEVLRVREEAARGRSRATQPKWITKAQERPVTVRPEAKPPEIVAPRRPRVSYHLVRNTDSHASPKCGGPCKLGPNAASGTIPLHFAPRYDQHWRLARCSTFGHTRSVIHQGDRT